MKTVGRRLKVTHLRCAIGMLTLCALLAFSLPPTALLAASTRTPNFVVTGPTQPFVNQVGAAAEKYRDELATWWLGKKLPRWAQPCPINVAVAPHLGAGGQTSFAFDRGEVFNWNMTIQGSAERILDSVLPHEITHTIFASHFRRPLPRWADEGACTTVEHFSERRQQQLRLVQFLKTGRGIAFDQMFVMRDYPEDVMPLYSQGYSLASFLIQQGGRQKFLAYLGEGMQSEQWAAVTKKFYGFSDLAMLQTTWNVWVSRGSQPLEPAVQVVAFQGGYCRERCQNAAPPMVDIRPGAVRINPGVANRGGRAGGPAAKQNEWRGDDQGWQPATNVAGGNAGPAGQTPAAVTQTAASPATDYSGQISAIDGRLGAVETSVAKLDGRVSQIEQRPGQAEPRPTEAAPAVPTAGGTSRTGFAGWWKSKSVGEALGGNLGTGLAVAGGVLATGLGVPPLARKIGGMFITRVGNQVGAKVGGQVDQFTQQRLSDLEARIGHRHAQHANIVNEGPPSGPQILHSTNFAAIPDNSEGEAWQFASKRYAEDHPHTAVHVRAIQKIKDLYLSGKEPMV